MSKDPAAARSLGTAAAKLALCCDVSVRVVGGARRDRTDDLMLAKHALSQLSYGPNISEDGGPG
jgi:hypothetical protein